MLNQFHQNHATNVDKVHLPPRVQTSKGPQAVSDFFFQVFKYTECSGLKLTWTWFKVRIEVRLMV